MKSNKLFICYAENITKKLHNGYEYEVGERAIYYAPNVGRRRNYREAYPIPTQTGLKLKTFKLEKNAQDLCDYTNESFGDNFKVLELAQPTKPSKAGSHFITPFPINQEE